MKIPCGRTQKNKYLCCTRKHCWYNTYWVVRKLGKQKFCWVRKCLFCHCIVELGTSPFMNYKKRSMDKEKREVPVCGLCPNFYIGFCKKYRIFVQSSNEPPFKCNSTIPDIKISVKASNDNS